MHILVKSLFIFLSFTISATAFAYREIPFCPSGGPPGWMNYFDYKRDQNNWRNHLRNQNYQRHHAAQPERFQPFQNPAGNSSATPVQQINQRPIRGYTYPTNQNRHYYNQRNVRRN